MPTSTRQAPEPGHRHDASVEDALAFVNTLEFSSRESREDFGTPAAVLAWLEARGLVHQDSVDRLARETSRPSQAAAFLEHVRDVRTAFRALLEAQAARRPAGQEALGTINSVLRQGYPDELVPAPTGARLDHRHPGEGPDGALASLAQALVRELTIGRPERLKVCANDECRWVFEDASPAGRRKWCDMSSCGNRAKARRHRARQREATG